MALLDSILSADDVKNLSPDQIPGLIAEVRQLIIDVTLKNGGHLASSLGAVEIVVALLRAFNPMKDRIVFDVGHQSYAWKILTGRAKMFGTLRTQGGLSGYPKLKESPCDHFGVGHSSTSISAVLGYALARDIRKEDHHVVAVIGDGAIINGEAFEALNHAGTLEKPVMIVLNDNNMAISPRFGGMAMHLARLSACPLYKTTKRCVKHLCRRFCRTDSAYQWLKQKKNGLKRFLSPANVFSNMGLTYWGPFDGHDEAELERVFELGKQYDGPLLIHVVTRKGKGYAPAEQNPVAYHGVSPAAKTGCESASVPKKRRSWSAAAADCIERLAEHDAHVVALTPAMTEGSALQNFQKRFPQRFFDVGIAEEHMVTLAAGLAAGGLKPVACIYSTFLQRAMDQLVHDVCLQNLPVIFAVDRAGLVGEDGETHQGLFELNWVRIVPNLRVWSPFDEPSLIQAFDEAARSGMPSLIRYPRGTVCEKALCDGLRAETGLSWLPSDAEGFAHESEDWCIVATGASCPGALEARALTVQRGMPVPELIFLNQIAPIPEKLFELLRGKRCVVVAEENYRRGGLAEELSLLCSERLKSSVPVIRSLALDRVFVAQGTQAQQRIRHGLTPERILELYASCCDEQREES